MKNLLISTLFGAALLVTAAGFAQSTTSPQKGDEDPTPRSTLTPSPTVNTTDANSTGSTSGAAGAHGSADRTTGVSTAASRTYSGTVRTIDAGRTLVITMADGRTQTFDLSDSPKIDASVAVGSRVRVKETVDADGNEVVTVEPYR